jgi:hypothetical protein
MPSPIINLLGEIVIQIRDIDQEAHQEYRWYELYDKIFNYIVQISPKKKYPHRFATMEGTTRGI